MVKENYLKFHNTLTTKAIKWRFLIILLEVSCDYKHINVYFIPFIQNPSVIK